MADYRLYFLDRQDHIRDVKALTCADDEQAVQLAAAYAAGGRLELWRRSTLIRRFGSGPSADASQPHAAQPQRVGDDADRRGGHRRGRDLRR